MDARGDHGGRPAKQGAIGLCGPRQSPNRAGSGGIDGPVYGPAGGEVLILLGMHQFGGQLDRETGFRAVLRERFPNCRVVDVLESAGDQTRAGHVVRQAMLTRPKLRGIYNTSSGNSAIAQHMRSLGRLDQFTLITHELTKTRRDLMIEGAIDAIIDQNPEVEVRRALDIVAASFQRMETALPLYVPTPFQIILRENCPNLDERFR